MPNRPFADIHNSHCQCRHLHIQICKHINKDRDNIEQHNGDYTDDCTYQYDRIDGCFADRCLELGFLLKMDCHSFKRGIQLPEDSPACTIFTSIAGKISGSADIESASVLPFSTFVSTSAIPFLSHLFSVCSVIICRASFMGTPAWVMLTN